MNDISALYKAMANYFCQVETGLLPLCFWGNQRRHKVSLYGGGSISLGSKSIHRRLPLFGIPDARRLAS